MTHDDEIRLFLAWIGGVMFGAFGMVVLMMIASAQ